MTAKEILAKVMARFDTAVPAAPTAPADTTAPGSTQVYKLLDGTEVTIAIKDPAANAEPSAGDMVTIAGAPAPQGVLTLEDGSTITVDATGAIVEFGGPGDPVTTDLTQAPAAPSLEQRVAAIEAELAKAKVPAVPTGLAMEADLKLASAKIDKQDEVIKGLFELVEKLTEMPSADPKTLTGAKKDQFDRANKKEEKFKSIMNSITKMKANK